MNGGTRKGFIYGLRVRGGPVRYIGQSVNPRQRFESLTDIRKGGTCGPLLKAWLLRHCGEVEYVLIEETAEMDAREQYWILYYRNSRVALLNVQPGGSHKYTDAASTIRLMEELERQWPGCDRTPPDPQDWAILRELIAQSRRAAVGAKRHRKRRASR